MIAPARMAAFDALRAIADARTDLGSAVAAAHLRLADPRDRALTSELVIGTERWRGALDYQLARVAGRPLETLDSAVLLTLRLALYQLLHLERVPARAVVHDAVTLVRRARKASAAGFVNAVLRRLARERSSLPWPARPAQPDAPAARSDAVAYLATVGSHPAWLVTRWLDRHGFDAVEARVRFNNQPAPLCLRPNRLVTTRELLAAALDARGVRTHATRYAPDGLIVDEGRPLQLPLAVEGQFLVQDESSQLVPELVQPTGAARVLDACAAPGGKTVALAAKLPAEARLVAADVRPRRIAVLRRTLRTCGVTAPVVLMPSEGGWPFRPAAFTHVLVDAPCSGLGTIRRDPDVRWRRSEDDLARFARVQEALLIEAAAVLAPGGILVYSTCSSEPDENDAVVARFLARRPDFRPRRLSEMIGLPSGVGALEDAGGALRTDPAKHGLEAFFAAVLERADAA